MQDSHVDIVRTEPLLGTSAVVARLVLVNESVIKVIDDDDPKWSELALRPISVAGATVSPDDAPLFLKTLSGYFGGTYLYATELHSFDSCPHPKLKMNLETVPYPPNLATEELPRGPKAGRSRPRARASSARRKG
jgi:hypothetical protein